MKRIIAGDIFAVIGRARDEGWLRGLDRLVGQCSGRHPSATALDLLIEASPARTEDGGRGMKLFPHKQQTRLFVGLMGNKTMKPVSMARLTMYADSCEPRSIESAVGIVSAVVTHEGYRRKGYGRRVMESLLADSWPLELRLEADDKGATQLYRGLGFKKLKSREYNMVLRRDKDEAASAGESSTTAFQTRGA
jgi:GNAT superfamily N-acetyltransferase